MSSSATMSGDDTLVKYIHTFCIEGPLRGTHESINLKVTRRALKAIACGVAVWGSMPSIAIAKRYAIPNTALGNVYSTANVITYTMVLTWAYHGVIDSTFSAHGEAERKLEGLISLAAKVGVKVLAVGLGVAAQSPRAFLAYYFNGDGSSRSVEDAALVYLAPSALTIISMDKTFSAILRRRGVREEAHQKVEACKVLLIGNKMRGIPGKIGDFRRLLASLPDKTGLRELTGTPEEQVMQLIRMICEAPVLAPKTTYQKVAGAVSLIFGGGILGVTSTVAHIAFGLYITKQAVATIEPNSTAADQWGAGVAVTLTNLYLTILVNLGVSLAMTHKLLTKPVEILQGDSMATRLRVKTRTLLGLTLIVTSCLSLAPLFESIDTFFEGKFRDVMTYTTPPGVIFMFVMAMEELADIIVEQSVNIPGLGIELERELVALDEALRCLSETVTRASPVKYAELLNGLPEDLFSKLTTGPDGQSIATQANILECIQRHDLPQPARPLAQNEDVNIVDDDVV